MRIDFTDFIPFLRSYPWRHHLLGLAPSVLMLCCIATWCGTGYELAAEFKAMRVQQPMLHKFMWFVSFIVPPLSYGLYAFIFWYGLRSSNSALTRLAIAYLVVQLLISFLLVRVLKIAVGMPRPMAFLDGSGYNHFTMSSSNHSFPSGHTSEILGTITPLLARRKKELFSLSLGLIAALVIFSRLFLSMHHISDIAASLLLGSTCGILIQYVSTRGCYEPQTR